MHCRICNNPEPEVFLSLGETPLANNFVPEEKIHEVDPTYPLAVFFCNTCKSVQLTYTVPPELMFKNYVYVTSTTKTFREHFTHLAKTLTERFQLGKNSLAVDIGSNDGLLVKGFTNNGVTALGVEPADNLAAQANKEGIETINDFFSKKTVHHITSKKGKASLVTANNVFAHIDNLHDVIENVKGLLTNDGVFIFEVAYLVDMMKNMTFDAIYHEHIYNHAFTPLNYLMNMHQLQIFDVEHISTHGGSLRVYVKRPEGKWDITPNVKKFLKEEDDFGINTIATYRNFAKKVEKTKEVLTNYLTTLKQQGKKIVGYGAPAKTTTLLHYCNIGKDQIDYIVEDNPLKAGLYTPGNHIPAVPSERLKEDKPDYVLITAWNFAKEIIEKNKEHMDNGVKFIVPLPEPQIIG
ncbi:MAG TPA: class I SAM-dependent methyltransferase [Candidatus Nanoarchaeia archaeon]|nr:class I SAM-dependent methyltransferase [Candidatus Nanoarchaeia archaeon]